MKLFQIFVESSDRMFQLYSNLCFSVFDFIEFVAL